MEELLKHLGFTTPFIYAAAAYGFFHWLDKNASDEAKAALAQTMRFKDYKNEQVASALVEVFDRIYTYPLLRWRAFFRSLLFTTVVSAIFLFEVIRYISSSGYFIMPVTRECADERMLTIGCWVMFSIDQLQPCSSTPSQITCLFL